MLTSTLSIRSHVFNTWRIISQIKVGEVNSFESSTCHATFIQFLVELGFHAFFDDCPGNLVHTWPHLQEHPLKKFHTWIYETTTIANGVVRVDICTGPCR